MLDATPPSESDSGSPQRVARSGANTDAPRNAFRFSLLSVLGVALAAGMARLVVIVFFRGSIWLLVPAVLFLIALAASFWLAIMSIGMAVPWRRAGGRGRRSALSIALAIFALLGVALGFALIAGVVLAFMVGLSQI